MDCCNPPCYEGVISNCQEDIIVKCGLTPTTQYYWQIEDYHGNLYTIPFTSDAEGNGLLPAAALPEGFCNYASYGFKLRITTDEQGKLPANILLTSAYQCIDVKIKKGGEINQIGL